MHSPADRILGRNRPLIIGHRGFCCAAPENTLPSFKLAVAAGADLVELDVRQSKEGEWMAIHDGRLDRTTDAVRRWRHKRVPVEKKTAIEIRSLDAGSWFHPRFAGTRVPLLAEALETILKTSSALIEPKAGKVADLITFIRNGSLLNQVIIQSFDWRFLRQFHEQEPRQALGALGPASRLPDGKRPFGVSRKLNRAWLDQVHKTGARVVVWTRKVSKGAVRLAHERGLKVWVYTINDKRLARRLLRSGADGLITNHPLKMRGVVAFAGGPTVRP